MNSALGIQIYKIIATYCLYLVLYTFSDNCFFNIPLCIYNFDSDLNYGNMCPISIVKIIHCIYLFLNFLILFPVWILYALTYQFKYTCLTKYKNIK